MNDKTKKTWISIVIAVLIIFVILGLALVGSAAFWIRRHIDTQFTSVEIASEEFNRERARFAGQQPLIEMRGDHDEPVVHRRTAETPVELKALRVLAFDPHAKKLVRVSIPFWLLRLAPSRHLRLRDHESGVEFDADRLHLTVEDLERAGPGLVLDAREGRQGASVLVWAE